MKHKRFVSALIPLLVLAAAALACGSAPAGKPTVAILAPPNGAQAAVGQTVEVQFHAEDAKAVLWVQMMVGSDVVATMQSPLGGGQTPLDGILRWTPSSPGAFTLMVGAHNADGQNSDPAAVSITVVQTEAATPTLISPTEAAPTETVDQPTVTTKPDQPAPTATATTKPAQPAQPAPTATPTPTTKPAAADAPTATPTPTTKPPTPTPTTKPPTPTNTQPPTPVSPEIVNFYATAYTVRVGQCTTLYWETRNTTQVHLNQGAVTAAGNRTYCSEDLNGGANVFELRASNGVQTAMQSLTITKQEPQVFNAAFVPGLSGSVSDHGGLSTTVYPGDGSGDNNYIGFMSFDIVYLPGNATIKSATLDLGPCSTTGDPFGGLAGQLYVTYLYYGDLDTGDYSASGGEYLASVYSCPGGQIDVTASVDAHKNAPYYQITLSWPVKSDFDGATDDVTYTAPSLEIVYYP